MKSLQETIKELIELKQEGAYWDFKRQWYGKSKNEDMLHDIICMANNLVNKDAYIVIGVDEENDYKTIDISSDEERRTTENIVSFLRTKEFAGEIRPKVTVETMFIESNAIDVIVIHNTNDTPYYLKKKSGKVRPYNIYTRVQDTNTPCDSSADIHHVESLWKKRFGLLLTPIEKCKLYLKDKDNWEQSEFYKEIKYYKPFPEYTIETNFEMETNRNGYEYCMFDQRDMNASWASIFIRYHQTVLVQTLAISLDGGICMVAAARLGFMEFWNHNLCYDYMIKDSLTYILNCFLSDENSSSAVLAHSIYMNNILVFDSEEEKSAFEEYVRNNWDDSYEEMIQAVPTPHLPDDDREYDYKLNQYKTVQVVQRMLRKFRMNRIRK